MVLHDSNKSMTQEEAMKEFGISQADLDEIDVEFDIVPLED